MVRVAIEQSIRLTPALRTRRRAASDLLGGHIDAVNPRSRSVSFPGGPAEDQMPAVLRIHEDACASSA